MIVSPIVHALADPFVELAIGLGIAWVLVRATLR